MKFSVSCDLVVSKFICVWIISKIITIYTICKFHNGIIDIYELGWKSKYLLTFFRRRGVQVSCSKKHCHSKDFNQRQCQRLSITLPIDNNFGGFTLALEEQATCSNEVWLRSDRGSFVDSGIVTCSPSGG